MHQRHAQKATKMKLKKDQGIDLFSDKEPDTIAQGNTKQESNPDVAQARNIKRTFEDKVVQVEGLWRRKYIKTVTKYIENNREQRRQSSKNSVHMIKL